MKFVELLKKLQSEKTPAIINGIKGKVAEIDEELLTIETIRWKDKGKGLLAGETIYIPLHNILTISLGEREIQKSQVQVQMEKELADL